MGIIKTFIFCFLSLFSIETMSLNSLFCEFTNRSNGNNNRNDTIIEPIENPDNFYLTLLEGSNNLDLISNEDGSALISLRHEKNKISIMLKLDNNETIKTDIYLNTNRSILLQNHTIETDKIITKKSIKSGYCYAIPTREIYDANDMAILKKYKSLNEVGKYYSSAYFTFMGRIKISVIKDYPVFKSWFSIDDDFVLKYYHLVVAIYYFNEQSYDKLSFKMSPHEFQNSYNRNMENVLREITTIKAKKLTR